jgi:hypothetical protein
MTKITEILRFMNAGSKNFINNQLLPVRMGDRQSEKNLNESVVGFSDADDE